MTIHNIDFSLKDSYSHQGNTVLRESRLFSKSKRYLTSFLDYGCPNFRQNQYLSHRNRTIFGEFDFAVDKFRPSSVSWSPGYEFVQKGTWVPDGEFIAQITQIKTFCRRTVETSR